MFDLRYAVLPYLAEGLYLITDDLFLSLKWYLRYRYFKSNEEVVITVRELLQKKNPISSWLYRESMISNPL